MENLCNECKKEECPRCEEKARKWRNIVNYAEYLTYGLIGGFAFGVYLMSGLKKVNKDQEKESNEDQEEESNEDQEESNEDHLK